MKKRAKGGAFGGPKLEENNGRREPGKIRKMDPGDKVMKVASKTSSDGFKSGGRIEGEKDEKPNFAKRARGGGVFSTAGKGSDRVAKSDSGHEGE